MTVAAAITDFERRVAAVHAALDAGREPELPAFEAEPLEGRVTEADRARLAAAMEALQACVARLHDSRRDLLDEYAHLGTRRRAAVAYGVNA